MKMGPTGPIMLGPNWVRLNSIDKILKRAAQNNSIYARFKYIKRKVGKFYLYLLPVLQERKISNIDTCDSHVQA